MPNKTHQAFLNAIASNPEDKTTFGVWADKLEEEGHDELAHFIRKHTVNHPNSPKFKNYTYNNFSITSHKHPSTPDLGGLRVFTNQGDSGDTGRVNPKTGEPATFRQLDISPRPVGEEYPKMNFLELSFAEEPDHIQNSIHDSIDTLQQDSPEKYSMYIQDYEKAIKYAANEEWKDLLAKIHEQPENRHTYGVLADWLDDKGHTDLAHFFRKHGYSQDLEPEQEFRVHNYSTTTHLSPATPPEKSTDSKLTHSKLHWNGKNNDWPQAGKLLDMEDDFPGESWIGTKDNEGVLKINYVDAPKEEQHAIRNSLTQLSE
jgi:uncharacterized protein (TIGR02996 family)